MNDLESISLKTQIEARRNEEVKAATQKVADAIFMNHLQGQKAAALMTPKTLRDVLVGAYGKERARTMIAERQRWHRHAHGGGWVRDDAVVAEDAFLGPQSAVHGPKTTVSAGTHMDGETVIGSHVTMAGFNYIDSSFISGEVNPKHKIKAVHVIDSLLSHATCKGSDVRKSRIQSGWLDQSSIEKSEVSGRDTAIHFSTVFGAEIEDSVVAESSVAKRAQIKNALVVDTAVTEETLIENVEMEQGHVKRSRKYAALERAGAVAPNHFRRSGEAALEGASGAVEHGKERGGVG